MQLDGNPKWIWLADVHKNQYAAFARVVDLDAAPRAAHLAIFAETHYKLYINGQFVNAGPAPFRKPVLTVDEYEVRPFLKPGANLILILARFVGETVKYGTVDKPGVLAALSLETDRGKSVVVSDGSWKGLALPAWRAETPKMTWALGGIEEVDLGDPSYLALALMAGEDYVAGMAGRSWGFPEERLQPVSTRPLEAGLELRARQVPLLAWTVERPLGVPRLVRMTPEIYNLRDNAMRLDSEYREAVWEVDAYAMLKAGGVRLNRRRGEKGFGVLYDLMRMTAGDFTIEIRSPGPATVDVAFAEHLREGRPNVARNGSLYYCRLHLVEGVNRFRLYASTGYRYLYVVLKDFEGDLEIMGLQANECRAALDYRDEFEVPDRALCGIYDISRRAIMLNVQAEPYDCNTRERGTYWGDSQWVLESVGLMTGNFSHMRRLCEAMQDEYRAVGMLNSSLYGMGEPLYDYCLVPVEMLKRYIWSTDDRTGLAGMVDTAGRIVQDFRRLKDARGLIMLGPHPAGEGRHGLLFLDHPGLGWHPRTTMGIGRADCSAGINLFYLQALQALDAIRSLTGFGTSCTTEIESLRQTLRARFMMEGEGVLADSLVDGVGHQGCSQIVNALAVTTGVLQGDEASRAIRKVLDVEHYPWIAQGSPYTYFFIAEALVKVGLPAAGMEAIKQYWTPMLARGATTTWEAFGGEHHDSFCHAWSAPLPYLLFKGIMGVSPLEPGYRRIVIKPCLEAFDEFKGACCVPSGRITVAWHREGVRRHVRVSLPAGVEGLVTCGGLEHAVTGQAEWVL